MRVVVPLWLIILTMVSLAPDPVKHHLGTKGPFHSAAHLMVFALTGLIFCWKSTGFRSRLAGALAGCCTALLLEILEAWFYHNRVEWTDVCVGCLGVFLGFAVSTMLHGAKTPA